MKIKAFSILLAAIMWGAAVMAADDASILIPGITLGCDSNDALSSDAKIVEAAVCLPPDLLADYAGASLSAISTRLHSRLNVDELSVWVRHDLDGENICEATVSRNDNPSFAKGINIIALGNDYMIPTEPEKSLFIGVSCITFGSSKTICHTSPTDLPAGQGFVRYGGGEWTDISDSFTLCIDAVLTGENLPVDCIRLEKVVFDPYYILDQGGYSVSFSVLNTGVNNVASLDMTLDMEDSKMPFTQSFSCDIAPQESASFSISMPNEISVSTSDGERSVSISISAVNGHTPSVASSAEARGTYLVTPYDMRRRVLLEEFTTESCPNCPRVGEYVHNLVNDSYYKDLIVPMCHHSGYGIDRHTIDSDKDYVWFYDVNQMYAPAVMIDRLPMVNSVAPFNPVSELSLAQAVDDAARREAFVSVSLHAEMADDVVHVKVRGAKTVESLCDNPHLVCVLTEDAVPGPSQSGYYGPDTYIHNHVCRDVSETWGTPVPFEGDDYEYDVDLSLDKVLVRENTNVVAYIFNYNPSNRRDCEVQNAAIIPYSAMESSVMPICHDNSRPKPSCWYTLCGAKLDKAPSEPGFYIADGEMGTRIVVIRK